MGDEVRLFNGRLRIDSTPNAPVANPAGEPALVRADALANAAARLHSPSSPTLFDRSGRWSLTVDAAAAGPVTVGEGLALPAALQRRPGESPFAFATRVAAMPALQRDQAAMASGGFSLSYTPTVRPGELSSTVTVSASGTAEVNALGLQNLPRDAAGFAQRVETLERDARDLMRRQAELLAVLTGPDMQRLRAALARGVTIADAGRILEIADPLLQQLTNAIRFLDDAQSFLQRADSLLSDGRQFEGTFRAQSTARGAFNVDYSFRDRVLYFERGGTRVGVTIGATVGLIAPLANPAPSVSSEVPGLRPFRTLMVSAQAVATVAFAGLEELRGTLSDLRGLAADAEALGRRVRSNPFGLAAPGRAAEAQAQLARLQRDATAITERLREIGDQAHVEMQTGVRTTEATGVGGGLREVGASLDISTRSFDLNVAIVLRNLVGYLPGRYTDYRISEDAEGNPGLSVVGEGERNVFSVFYPASVGVSASATYRPGPGYSLQLRAGVEGMQAGGGAVGYVGLMAHLQSAYMGLGVVAPLARHGSPPQIAAQLGLDTGGFRLGLGVSANGEVFTNPEALRGASVQFNLGGSF